MSYKDIIKRAISERIYKSSIPENAECMSFTEGPKEAEYLVEEYFVEGELVGRKIVEAGAVYWEYGLKQGRKQGEYYYFHADESIKYKAEFIKGKQEGIASQWSESGELMCVSVFENGTGIDFWGQEEEGEFILSEERHYKDGLQHGVERWWNSSTEIWQESFFKEGKLHGISREWTDGKLDSDFPKFYVEDKEITKESYFEEIIARQDLPKYNIEDDEPYRQLNDDYVKMRENVRSLKDNSK